VEAQSAAIIAVGLVMTALIAGAAYNSVGTKAEPYTPHFPFVTWEAAWEYTENQFPESDLIAACQGEDRIRNYWLEGNINQNDDDTYGGKMYYGPEMIDGGRAVQNECLTIDTWDDQGRPTGGQTAWRLDFDPNDGRVWRRFCNPNFVENCPPNIKQYPNIVGAGTQDGITRHEDGSWHN